MKGNDFEENKVVSLIFEQFWSRSHLSKLDQLTLKKVYKVPSYWEMSSHNVPHFTLMWRRDQLKRKRAYIYRVRIGRKSAKKIQSNHADWTWKQPSWFKRDDRSCSLSSVQVKNFKKYKSWDRQLFWAALWLVVELLR